MNNITKLLYAVSIIAVLFGIYIVLNTQEIDFIGIDSEGPGYACTMDAKQCPDGTFVGRSGPKCEFAKCPEQTYKGQKLNQSFTLNGLKITPIKIVEDSRCAEGTQCVWAGRVVVKTSFEFGSTSKTIDVEVNKPVDVLGFQIFLNNVTPNKSTSIINEVDYALFYKAEIIKK